MSEECFKSFVETMNSIIGVSYPDSWNSLSDIQLAQHFLEKMNEYFYQTYEGIGTTIFRDEEINYFSEFHKYWEKHHEEILNVKINNEQALLAAKSLSKAIKKYGKGILDVLHDTQGLNPQAVAQVRYFTANQDFREPPEDQFGKYLEDPAMFDEQVIVDDPADFINFIDVTRQSQSDKRFDFAKNAANYLIDNNIHAFDLAEKFNHNAEDIRDALIGTNNIGYGAKKANMFVRDMVDLNVWPNLYNVEEINVASDINTMKLSLRIGLLQTDIPLLSSFLDIFCYQYETIDRMSALAWRVVWQEWKKMDPSTAPGSPSSMDFLLYRLGREYCKDMLVLYNCNEGHKFFYFGARKRICHLCKIIGRRTKVIPKSRFLPCQLEKEELPQENGKLLLKDTNLLHVFGGVCIFEDTCKPKEPSFLDLNPPKSISVKGRTSWTASTSTREKGGGGMMG